MSAAPSYAPRGTAAPAVRVAYGAMPAPLPALAALAGATMGTTWSARMALPPGVDAEAARSAVQAALNEVVAQMSTWESTSDITRFNQAAPGWQALPDGFFYVLRHALALAEDSGGAYDPTVGPLVNAWGFGPHQRAFEPPSPAAIDAARARCGWRRVALDATRQAAMQPGGAYLDLSSIAKGHGVDRAALALDALGISQYLVEVGGELRARGKRPDGQPWRVAIEVPDASDQHALALPLQALSIATSGDYRRHAGSGDARYAHTIDPRSGQPVRNNVASVSVLHAECMMADALATVLTVLGEADGLAYARRHDLAALFILRDAHDYRVVATPAFQALAQAS
ncbi:FAD:protein FMN transferase [Achromobacter piechaudii]|uniref:FAD:protein FMN transferase n=2 Tax=Achromobacter piechaudii TaxID=72556 RepID=A0ABN7EYZ0_9BURK|nr:FAD:protein FMN transferase [Achromobacter piechaudii]CAB3853952.1 FAD:protein FMN transferase [Achromobacter piechaudii]CAB3950549.1 FAD:protein FMN transferase [Achromobacter piechaudii]